MLFYCCWSVVSAACTAVQGKFSFSFSRFSEGGLVKKISPFFRHPQANRLQQVEEQQQPWEYENPPVHREPMPQMAPMVENNLPIEMPMDTYQDLEGVVPEPLPVQTAPFINENFPVQIPLQYYPVPSVVPKPKPIKTSFMIIKQNQVAPTFPKRWSPYAAPITAQNQPPYAPPTTVQNGLPNF